MACLINSGYALGCRDNIGGVKSVFIGNYESAATYTYDADESITATTSTVTYHTFEQEMETASFTQNMVVSIENGTVFFDQQLGLTFYKNNAALRNTLILLAQANMSVIIQDQVGEYWLLGHDNGVRATGGASNTGKAYGDLNGVTITLQGKEKVPAYRIDDISIFTITA